MSFLIEMIKHLALQKTAKLMILGLTITCMSYDLSAEPSPSDKYCGFLQDLQAKVYRETAKPTALDDLISFVNSLIQKVSLEKFEQEAIQKKMSFEDFQKWANDQHATKVSDHYKPKYLEHYIKDVCGEITNSATFGAEPDPDLSATAEKQFDPSGHPYADPTSKKEPSQSK